MEDEAIVTEIDPTAEAGEADVQAEALEDPLLLGLSSLLSELLTEVRSMRTELRERNRNQHPGRPSEGMTEKIKITEI